MDSGIRFWRSVQGAPGAGLDASTWVKRAVARWIRAARLQRTDCVPAVESVSRVPCRH